MKTLVLLFTIPALTIASCNTGPKNPETAKDPDKNAALVENAEVEGEKAEGEPESVEDFVREAASGGLMEVELGKFAQQNAANVRVKNFGSMMVRDHSRANDELKQIASQKNIPVPATMEKKHQDKVDDLKKESGAEFDRKYLKEMVDDHEKDINKFSKQADDGKDPEIKAFAAKNLQVLQLHHDSATKISNALNKY